MKLTGTNFRKNGIMHLAEYEDFSCRRETRLRELIEDLTADEEMQEKIYQALMPLILWGR